MFEISIDSRKKPWSTRVWRLKIKTWRCIKQSLTSNKLMCIKFTILPYFSTLTRKNLFGIPQHQQIHKRIQDIGRKPTEPKSKINCESLIFIRKDRRVNNDLYRDPTNQSLRSSWNHQLLRNKCEQILHSYFSVNWSIATHRDEELFWMTHQVLILEWDGTVKLYFTTTSVQRKHTRSPTDRKGVQFNVLLPSAS